MLVVSFLRGYRGFAPLIRNSSFIILTRKSGMSQSPALHFTSLILSKILIFIINIPGRSGPCRLVETMWFLNWISFLYTTEEEEW